MEYDLACFGSNTIDDYVTLGKRYAGGCPLNSAVHASALGVKTCYIGAVGDDEGGRIIRMALARHHLSDAFVHTLPGSTARCEIFLEGDERVFGDYSEGVLKDFVLGSQEMEILAGARICLCDCWGEQNHRLKELSDKGAVIAYDAADHIDEEEIQRILPYCTYVFFSGDQDTSALRGRMKEIQKLGPRTVIATFGAEGSLCLEKDFVYCQAEKAERVVDTLGAGDTYIAGFLAGILQGGSTHDAMKLGSMAALKTLMHHGGFE